MGQVEGAGKHTKINNLGRRVAGCEKRVFGGKCLVAGGDHRRIDINPVIDRLRIGSRLIDKCQHGTISAANIGNCDRLLRCQLMNKR